MVNFETEKNLIRKMFKEIDTVFENDGVGIEDTIKAEGVNIIFGRSVPSGSRNFRHRSVLFVRHHPRLKAFINPNYKFRGYQPYTNDEGISLSAACDNFWLPFIRAVKHIQRREDVFIAGYNRPMMKSKCGKNEVWVMSMGNFMGLFDGELFGMRQVQVNYRFEYLDVLIQTNGKTH